MLCTIYKSPRKPQTYLYLCRRDDFSAVPKALMDTFGKPQLVTVMDLASKKALAGAELEKVKQALLELGFYLQLPPPELDLLKQHQDWLSQQDPSADL